MDSPLDLLARVASTCNYENETIVSLEMKYYIDVSINDRSFQWCSQNYKPIEELIYF